MTERNQWRSYIFAVSSISINLAVVSAFLFATTGNRQIAEFNFPSSFQTAQAIATPQNLPLDKQQTEIIKAHQHYQYAQNGQAIVLKINYLVGTRGDVAEYLQNYTDISKESIKAKSIEQIEGIGYHALLRENKQAYLTGCVSPRSPSNVTQKQFSQYRYQNDLNWQTGVKWLQGRASIRDRRCLWILLSTPVSQSDIQVDYRVLETAWKDIYQWWLPNFPALVDN